MPKIDLEINEREEGIKNNYNERTHCLRNIYLEYEKIIKSKKKNILVNVDEYPYIDSMSNADIEKFNIRANNFEQKMKDVVASHSCINQLILNCAQKNVNFLTGNEEKNDHKNNNQ